MKTQSEAKVLKYLADTLGLRVKFTSDSGVTSLPYHLEEAYEFKGCELLGQGFIALFAKHGELTPASIEKHVDWCYKKTGKRAILVTDTLAAYNRKRLIERKVPFVVPGVQLYFPDLGLDLSENLKAGMRRVDKVAPASQLIILAALLGRLDSLGDFTATSLAARFGYSKMTMTRSIDELRGLGLVEGLGEGRYGEFQFVMTGEALWQRARPHMKSPVKKRIYLEDWEECLGFRAGEAALSGLSMLGNPQRMTWAVTSQQWKQLERTPNLHIIPEVSKISAHAEFEVWSYDPAVLADRGCVDPFSLALSLNDETDDRVQISVDEMLKGLSW
jgi:DNA-binding transcriptional ArsR family regulator